ncbi:MAG: hypothetical protein AB7E30_01475 [Lawsonibacter sp.]
MQTIYYSTNHFIRHQDNVINLEEYRRRQALAQEGSLAPQPQPEEYDPAMEEEVREQPALRKMDPRCRRNLRGALVLDICASLGIVLMTLTFTLRVLIV